ncbi:MAG: hypothetical protein GYA62_11095 [Bacteroidales bacterium]|jgi:hypothetical protein|nr:hypothetical protein [Bacteroidales bacterium]
MKRKENIFDKIGTLIPGYIGYKERESRRNCDRQLREQISDILSKSEKKILSIFENYELEEYSKIEKIRKKISNLKDNITYSPYGATALFSDYEIKENELDKIYQQDLIIIKLVLELEEIINVGDFNQINQIISDVADSVNKRNELIKFI